MNFIKKHRIKFIFILLIIIFAGMLLTVQDKWKAPIKNTKQNNLVNKNEQENNSSSNNNSENTSPKPDNGQNTQQQNIQFAATQQQQAYIKGYNLLYEKKYDEAAKAEDEVIQLYPDFYKAYDIKGIAQCYEGNYKDGVSNILKCLNLKNDYGHGRFDMGLANELQGNYDSAIEWYKQALQVESYEWSYYGIASIYGRRGDVKNAVDYLKQAIAINPNVKDEARHEEDFNNVKNSNEFKEVIS